MLYRIASGVIVFILYVQWRMNVRSLKRFHRYVRVLFTFKGTNQVFGMNERDMLVFQINFRLRELKKLKQKDLR